MVYPCKMVIFHSYVSLPEGISYIPLVLAGQLRQRHDLPQVMDQGHQLQPVWCPLATTSLGRLEATAIPQIREDLQRLNDAQLTWEDPDRVKTQMDRFVEWKHLQETKKYLYVITTMSFLTKIIG